jgi:hypothetical protein
MAQSVGDRISTSSSYLAPKRVGYIQIWLEEGNLPLVSEGQLLEDELPQWLDTIKPGIVCLPIWGCVNANHLSQTAPVTKLCVMAGFDYCVLHVSS